MRIDNIVLNNFGSYEGETAFDTKSSSGKNIILIGGKNGAGKTTLFTAMRVCLYGFMSFGYKNYNTYYIRAITKLINNNAKRVKPAQAHVAMKISLSNGRDLDQYHLVRAWCVADSLTETFTIEKNGVPLSEEEIADFEKYLLSLIPPELFNLYFFDGEKIADFFMNEGSNARIKEAFLTLCGYDTFDIMRRNFKRISGNNSTSSAALDEYWTAKQAAEAAQLKDALLTEEMKKCEDAVSTCDADIAALEKAYTQKGGISQEEWNSKLVKLREEEKHRDVWNTLLRRWANEIVPFIMIREQIAEIKDQITKENNIQKYNSFCEILDAPEIRKMLGDQTEPVKLIARAKFGGYDERILDLSFEQSAGLLAQVSTILDFEDKKIEEYKQAIKKSIARSATIRQELENSNISSVQTYMKTRAELFEKKSDLLRQRLELEQALFEQKEVLRQADALLHKTQSKLEEDLKKASINDISARAIVMLDKLQHILYRQQIEKVKDYFRKEIKTLMRKTNFIDDIKIDDDFNIFLYRNEGVSVSLLTKALEARTEAQIIEIVGQEALNELYRKAGEDTLAAVSKYCATCGKEEIILPIRVDQTSLSNGEKQIFIMALYHSLVQLGRHEIPFIIDTPFARIDTEHRRNISQHFFSALRGQVFILSTNEEIGGDHVRIMQDKIAATYMLENTENKRTTVVSDSYFEV